MNKIIRSLFVPGVILASLMLALALYRLPATHAQAEKQARRIVPMPVPAENLSASTAAPNATTQSFSNAAAITINASGNATPYPSNINVSGISSFTRLEVRLNGFSHAFPDDVDILLVGPQGQRTILMSDAGGTGPGVTNLNLTFAQTATTPIPDASTPTSGTFRPANYNPLGAADTFLTPGPGVLTDAPADLFVFNGTNPNGIWNLYVVDDVTGDSGSISGGWTLTFTVPQIFTVNSTADTTDGTCDATNCTLREAITAAQDGDLINFSSLFNTPQTINLLTALPDIARSITIQGTGAHLLTVRRAFNAATNFRVFNITNTATNGVAISGMTITGGNAGSGATFGGGIYSQSHQILTNVHVTGNTAGSGGGVALAFADGVFTHCSFSENTASDANGSGGGIDHQGTGGRTLRVINSTISGNRSVSSGGGIENFSSSGNSRLEITNSTITNNTAGITGGVDTFTQFSGNTATTTLRNTIVTGNSPNNLATGTFNGGAATFQTLGFNLSDNYNGVFTPLGTDVTNATPRLAPLALYGGQTPTHALLHSSPAINAGNASGATTDQRGQSRPFSGTIADIGAFEAQVPTSGVTVVTNTDNSGAGSLRNAIETLDGVNGTVFYDIQFDNSFFNIPRTILLTTGELDIRGNMNIIAPGANLLTVSGNNAFRVLSIASGFTAALSGMTITRGSATDFSGGIYNQGTLNVTAATISGNVSGSGGGIRNVNGTLRVDNSTIIGNSSNNTGGGFRNTSGTVTVTNSTISGNTVTTNSGGSGGIDNSGTLFVTNSTISGNTAPNGDSSGGGIRTDTDVTIINSTITNNSAAGASSASGVFRAAGSVAIRNSIIAANVNNATQPDVVGSSITSNGFNRIGNRGTVTFGATGDQSGTGAAPLNPLLGALQNNGGTTATHALLAGSPALDKGNNSGSNSDQRGLTRPVDLAAITNTPDGADIGAFEAQATENLAPSAAATAANVTSAGSNTYSFTVTYTDDTAINVLTIATNDVAVTGPNSFNVTPTFVSVNPSGNGTPRTATYSFTPPGGTWDSTDNGTYNIVMNANQVSDVQSNLPVPAGNIGSFTVNACTYTLSPASPQSVSSTGGNFNLMITTQASCVWTATENETWLSFTSTTTGTGNGTVSYTVAANTGASRTGTITVSGQTFTVFQATADATQDTDGDGIPDSVEIIEGRNPLVKDNDIFPSNPTSNRLFAMQQYRDFLGREGDPGGITNWVNNLNANALTRAQVIESFFNSAEFQNTGAPIVRLYFACFLRIPDYAGLQNWITAYRGGMPLETIANFFVTSPEFLQTYGSLNNTAFVTLVYNNVLGRAPDPTGLNNWVNALNNGMPRGTLMVNFSESQEYKNRIGNSVYVTMMYVGMLRRSPDQTGFNNWVAFLNQGNSGLALINGFITAQEYHNRFLP